MCKWLDMISCDCKELIKDVITLTEDGIKNRRTIGFVTAASQVGK